MHAIKLILLRHAEIPTADATYVPRLRGMALQKTKDRLPHTVLSKITKQTSGLTRKGCQMQPPHVLELKQ